MTAPAIDPVIVRIFDLLAIALSVISQANGFYTDIKGAGFEPIDFDKADLFPRVALREETSTISDANAKGYVDTVVIAIIGLLAIEDTDPLAGAYRQAFRLRDDLTRVLRSITGRTFTGTDGKELVRTWSLINEQREITPSDLATGFLEVAVRVSFDYRDFTPPYTGI